MHRSLLGPVLGAVVLAGCASEPLSQPPAAPPRPLAAASAELGRSARVIVVAAKPGDTLSSLASEYLGDPSEAIRIRRLDQPDVAPSAVAPGEVLALFRQPLDPGGLLAGPAVRVPILCYHRFTAHARSSSRMDVSGSTFEDQLRYVREHGYHPIALKRLVGFLHGREDLPSKPVVITIDDGYRSAYAVAYPLLRKYQIPATLFVYTDFVGSGEALSWAQISEMAASGAVDVEAHSRTHGDLTQKLHGEGDAAYQRRLQDELQTPRRLLEQRGAEHIEFFAYPYGAANANVLSAMKKDDWLLGLTVIRGGNPTWSDPLLLRREMVFGTDSVEVFAHRLEQASEASTRP